MKISEIDSQILCQHVRILEEDMDNLERKLLEALKTDAVSYVAGYTGIPEEELDEYEDITIAVLVLVSDMYDNRQMYVDKNYSNKVVETILNLYRRNLIPGMEDEYGN